MSLDNLFPSVFSKFILPFLKDCDTYRFRCTCTFFYQGLKKKPSKFRLEDEDCHNYFTEYDYHAKVNHHVLQNNLKLVINSRNGYFTFYGGANLTSRNAATLMNKLRKFRAFFKKILDPFIFPLNQVFQISLEYELFFFLCHLPQSNFRINRLRLGGFGSSGTSQIAQFVAPYLTWATDELRLNEWPDGIVPHFSSSLQILIIEKCESISFPSSMPPLKKLVIVRTKINDLSQLPFIEEIAISGSPCSSFRSIKCKRLTLEQEYDLDPAHFNNVEDLTLINCQFISDCRSSNYYCSDEEEEEEEDDQQKEEEEEVPNEIDYFKNIKSLSITFELSSTTLYLDLSQFHKLKYCTLDMSERGSFRGPLTTRLIPPSLKVMRLIQLPSNLEIDFTGFSTLTSIYLVRCYIRSLVGLGKVPYIYLENIRGLNDLTGLTKDNQKVTIRACSFGDYSAIRYNPEVVFEYSDLKSCKGLECIESLTFKNCKDLCDLSMLSKVSELTLEQCPSIHSYEGLENIPKLLIKDCKNLNIKEHILNAIISKPLNEYIIASDDLLSRLPDCLFTEIFKFLPETKVYTCLSTSSGLYSRLMKKSRMIRLSKRQFNNFFSNPHYRKKLLRRVDSCCKQVFCDDLIDSITEINCADLIDIGFYRLNLSAFALCTLMGKDVYYKDWFPVKHVSPFLSYPFSILKENNFLRIRELTLSDSWENVFEFLRKVIVHSLTLLNCSFPFKTLTLPITLTHLFIDNFHPHMIKVCPPLPFLRLLKCSACMITNISNFEALDEVILEDMDVVDVASLERIRKVSLKSITEKIENLNLLQNNEEINILNCGMKRLDCSQCFSNSRKINITLTSLPSEITINLSYYKKIESFSLEGSQSLLTLPFFDEDHIPRNLSSLTLNGIKNLTRLPESLLLKLGISTN